MSRAASPRMIPYSTRPCPIEAPTGGLVGLPASHPALRLSRPAGCRRGSGPATRRSTAPPRAPRVAARAWTSRQDLAGRATGATVAAAAAALLRAPLVDHRRQRRRHLGLRLRLARAGVPARPLSVSPAADRRGRPRSARPRSVRGPTGRAPRASPSPSRGAGPPAPGVRPGSPPAPPRPSGRCPLSSSIGSRRSVPIESKSTGIPARRPRSRADRRSVGTSPRSSRTIGRTSKMNDFVASRVDWTIAISSRVSGLAAAGSLAISRSTIWAWRTMLVRLWAGPSCIARAMSRRRSSWAARIIRETAGDTRAPVVAEPSIARRRRSSPSPADGGGRPPSGIVRSSVARAASPSR